MLWRADTNLVLGLHAVGRGVSELSAAFARGDRNVRVRLEDIAGTIRAHPTRSEAVQEAALKALGHATHVTRGMAEIRVLSLRLRPSLVKHRLGFIAARAENRTSQFETEAVAGEGGHFLLYRLSSASLAPGRG